MVGVLSVVNGRLLQGTRHIPQVSVFPSGYGPQPSLSLFSPRLCSGFKPKLSVSFTCRSPSPSASGLLRPSRQ